MPKKKNRDLLPGVRSGKECSIKRFAARAFKVVEGRSGASKTNLNQLWEN